MKIMHKKSTPCPVCLGFDAMGRGAGARCYGFTSNDHAWAHCTREEFSGQAKYEAEAKTWLHKLGGGCRCGGEHKGETVLQAPQSNKRALDKRYIYRDEGGRILFSVLRWIPKTFTQERWDEASQKWIGGSGCMDGVRIVPYKLPEILACDSSHPILIVEGEKDADTLEKLGFIATTNPRGAEKWRDEFSELLKSKTVVIIPDEDKPGIAHGMKVAESLAVAGVDVKVIRLGERAKDITEWVEKGATKEDIDRFLAGIPEESEALKIEPGYPAPEILGKELPPIDYIIEPLASVGNLTELQGEPKAGKSCFALYCAISAAAGVWTSDRFSVPKARRVLFITYEDGLRRIKNRLEQYLNGLQASGAPPNLTIYTHQNAPSLRLETAVGRARLTKVIEKYKAEYTVLDTLSHLHAGDENSKEKMQPVMDALKNTARDTNSSIMAVHHTGKPPSNGDGRSQVYRGRGSSVIAAAADVILDWGKREGNVTSCALFSKDDDTDNFSVIYKPDDEKNSVVWSLEDAEPEGERDANRLRIVQTMQELSKTAPEGVSQQIIIDTSGLTLNTVKSHLAGLQNEGRVYMILKGQRKIWKLTQA